MKSRVGFLMFLWLFAVLSAGLAGAQGYQIPETDGLDAASTAPPWPPGVFDWFEGEYGKAARKRLEQVHALVLEHRDSPTSVKLEEVNRFFNKVKYRPDERHWDEKEYWATPLEMLGTYGGDCEDIAIAKYMALTTMGVKDQDMYLVFVQYKKRVGHLVLAYIEPGTERREALILDNIKKRIVPYTERPDLTPIYMINDIEIVYRNRQGKIREGSPNTISDWEEIVDRRAEQHDELEKFLADSIRNAGSAPPGASPPDPE